MEGRRKGGDVGGGKSSVFKALLTIPVFLVADSLTGFIDLSIALVLDDYVKGCKSESRESARWSAVSVDPKLLHETMW